MNFWTLLFLLANAVLCIRLVFFSDRDRKHSRLVYRVVLYLVTIWVAHHIIYVVYHPDVEVHPLDSVLAILLLTGALLMRPEYLPGNFDHATTRKAYCRLHADFVRLCHWVWHPKLHGEDPKSRSRTR